MSYILGSGTVIRIIKREIAIITLKEENIDSGSITNQDVMRGKRRKGLSLPGLIIFPFVPVTPCRSLIGMQIKNASNLQEPHSRLRLLLKGLNHYDIINYKKKTKKPPRMEI